MSLLCMRVCFVISSIKQGEKDNATKEHNFNQFAHTQHTSKQWFSLEEEEKRRQKGTEKKYVERDIFIRLQYSIGNAICIEYWILFV